MFEDNDQQYDFLLLCKHKKRFYNKKKITVVKFTLEVQLIIDVHLIKMIHAFVE
jgi:hypothetical protein